MAVTVRIIEKELGWGYRTLRVEEFDTAEEARKYCDEWNECEKKNPPAGNSIFYARVEE